MRGAYCCALSLTADSKSNVPFAIMFNLHYPFTSDLCSPLVKLTNNVQLANQLRRAGIRKCNRFFFFFLSNSA